MSRKLDTILQTVIQHHPSRAHLLPALLAALPGAQVIADPDPGNRRRSAWRSYQACLEALEPDASHLLIVQDDAIVCRDFAAALPLLIAARPDDLLCLFAPGAGSHRKRVLQACAAGERWAELDPRQPFIPLVAAVWPRALAERFLAYGPAFRPTDTSDDGNAWRWAKAEGVRTFACVPSLVEHPDREVSAVGKASFGGRNPARVAACWLGPEASALDLAW